MAITPGQILINEIESRGMSVRALAARTQIKSTTIARYIIGRRRITREHAEAIAGAISEWDADQMHKRLHESALRYCALADRYEQLLTDTPENTVSAYHRIFTAVENQLRSVGTDIMRQNKSRQKWLNSAIEKAGK